ncbi:MAG: hypothetical protein KDJ27_03490 [Gammaproteobacteria bacterium]|nr:hypothetical protein [Gammaproteobacteria bacterium]MCB1922801.1 hypothetical protein [Gammaproteobacteria bacterium]
MAEQWLQIKGDPSVRAFLFEQQRVQSLFDEHLDRIHGVMHALLSNKGVFHVKAHYSSSQLTCWFYDDPYNYRVYVREEATDPGFLDSLPERSYEGRHPRIGAERITPILDEFKRLRLTDEQIYLRNASINRINGMIGMTFSCDGSHYIDCEDFFRRLDCFGKDV